MFSESSEDDLLDENSPKLQRSNARRFGKVRFIVITGGVHLMSRVETVFSDSRKKKKKELKEKRERMEREAVSVLCQTALWDFWGRILVLASKPIHSHSAIRCSTDPTLPRPVQIIHSVIF